MRNLKNKQNPHQTHREKRSDLWLAEGSCGGRGKKELEKSDQKEKENRQRKG